MKETRRISVKKLENTLKDWDFLNLYNEDDKQEFIEKYGYETFNPQLLLEMSEIIEMFTARNWNGLSALERVNFLASLIASECVTSTIEF